MSLKIMGLLKIIVLGIKSIANNVYMMYLLIKIILNFVLP